MSRQKQHRETIPPQVTANHLAKFNTTKSRNGSFTIRAIAVYGFTEFNIQNQQVRGSLLQHLPESLGFAQQCDLITARLQQATEQVEQSRIIIHNHHPSC